MTKDKTPFQIRIKYFNKYFNMQKKYLGGDSRRLAETYYQMGVAHSFSDDFEKAMENFSLASSVMESRLTNMKAKVVEMKAMSDEDRAKREFFIFLLAPL